MARRERVCAVVVMLLPTLLLLLLTLVDVASAVPESCSAVKAAYRRQRFRDPVPLQPISGEHLQMCRQETTCCTEVMERKLSVESRQEYDTHLKNLLNPMATLLAKKNTKLNEVFGKLLNYSKKSFHDMFSRTYGILYQQNSDVFVKLYDELEKYFKTGELDLQETMDNFFTQLYERMFRVMNGQYTFSPRYLKCVTLHMEQLQPFRDVPEKLTIQIKRSFVALRTFVQGLATGRDVVRNVLKVNPSVRCVHELMRMNQCATCAGQLGSLPCRPYCTDVINLCFVHHKPLSSHWFTYIEAMVSIAERLENPFNIENVVQPVNYKVSDAIMNFQESGLEISEKVFKGCGSPRLGRNKRQAAEGELNQDFLDFSTDEGEDTRREREQENISVSRHIHEIKAKIRNTRNFWEELPMKMCHVAASEGATNCWTGTKVGKYETKGGFNVTEPPHNSAMDEQVMRLKVITSKLHEAFKGRDVSWIDDESWLDNGRRGHQGEQADADPDAMARQEEGSGSGDGDSSRGSIGHYPPDDEDAYTTKNKYDNFQGYDDDEDIYSANSHGSGHDGGYDKSSSYDDIYEGSGWGSHGEESEGSGDEYVVKSRAPVQKTPASRPPQRPPSHSIPKADPDQPPSAAATETMSLKRAITIYMLPAFIMFIGSLA